MDETGFCVGVGKDQWVITKDHVRPLYLASSNNRESITVVERVNAAGRIIALMIILASIFHQERWFTSTHIENNCLLV